ncbi:hypothetical protein GTA08_BOTSDO09308 [Botryosphaeria dothidea]|uniref:Uncharacterized protein n=1 Tax=Botryosphaeria dothidea TaxID=55169 RepID=A0A8H4IMG0_9PEZI|nr:hypothetical protein GTA08_BOTSDO09308 [Botryosphaeria dothidea]
MYNARALLQPSPPLVASVRSISTSDASNPDPPSASLTLLLLNTSPNAPFETAHPHGWVLLSWTPAAPHRASPPEKAAFSASNTLLLRNLGLARREATAFRFPEQRSSSRSPPYDPSTLAGLPDTISSASSMSWAIYLAVSVDLQ